MPNSSIKEKVLNQIENQDPKPKWYFEVISAVQVTLIILTISLAGVLLGFFIWDAWQIFNFRESVNAVNKVQTLFLELPFLVLLISLGGYLIYRHTNLPGVKNRSLIFGSILAFTLIISGLVLILPTLNAGVSTFYEGEQARLETLPLHRSRVERIFEPNERYFAGVLTKMEMKNEGNLTIFLTNPKEERQFTLTQLPPFKLVLGNAYEVDINRANPSEVRQIKPLPRGPKVNRPQRPLSQNRP